MILKQVWNLNAETALRGRSKVMERVHRLLPDVKFIAEFYKREINLEFGVSRDRLKLCLFPTAHQTHSAFEGSKKF